MQTSGEKAMSNTKAENGEDGEEEGEETKGREEQL